MGPHAIMAETPRRNTPSPSQRRSPGKPNCRGFFQFDGSLLAAGAGGTPAEFGRPGATGRGWATRGPIRVAAVLRTLHLVHRMVHRVMLMLVTVRQCRST